MAKKLLGKYLNMTIINFSPIQNLNSPCKSLLEVARFSIVKQHFCQDKMHQTNDIVTTSII